MSFRLEEKLLVNKNKLFELIEWIITNEGYKLFPDRIVSSTYFDNKYLQSYIDSEEGIVPRKKIRVRSYSKEAHKQSNSTLEIKTSSVEGRYKISSKNFKLSTIMKNGIFDKSYGICKPSLRVTYNRMYFLIKNVRLTIDTNIRYQDVEKFSLHSISRVDQNVIVELKTSSLENLDYLMREFPFQRTRFSKYSNGINICKRNSSINNI